VRSGRVTISGKPSSEVHPKTERSILRQAGLTRAECEQLISEGIALHLAGMRADGEPIPEPTSVDATIVSIPAA
jgi:hypothetical protein